MYSDKIYLDDQPELYLLLATICNELDLDSLGSGLDNWIHELECHSRDGFIPHLHNHGGFDVYNTLESEPTGYCDCGTPDDC